MICTLLQLAILSPNPVVIDNLVWSRHNMPGRATHLIVKAYRHGGLADTAEPFDQSVTVLEREGDAALIKLPDGREIYTRYEEDLRCG